MQVPNDSRPSPDHAVTRRVTRIVLTLAWGLLIPLSFLSAIEDSPIRPSRKAKMAWMTILPEGWSFFTKSPRSPEIIAYKWSGQHWERISYSATAGENLWGITRNSRVQGVEIGALFSAVPADAWTEDIDPFRDDFQLEELPLMTIRSNSVRPTACGTILIEERPPVPWAWSRSADTVRMPGRFARLAVTCTHPDA